MLKSKDFKFGITNQGDAGLDFSWTKRMKNVIGAVIISKAANDELIDKLLEYKDKVIYHATCTGLGGTEFEPNVPTVEEKFNHIKKLINCGFPKKQIVVRIDPLLPMLWIDPFNKLFKIDYISILENILSMTEAFGIERVRYSYLNVSKKLLTELQHTSHEFVNLPNTVQNNRDEIQLALMNPSLEYEACSENIAPPFQQIGCVSDKDLQILGLNLKYTCDFETKVRRHNKCCRCAANRLELILVDKFKCDHNCKYCYWK